MTRLPYFRASVGTGVKVSVSTRQIRSGVVANDLAIHDGGQVFVLELHIGWCPLHSPMPSSITLPKLKRPAGLSQHIGRFCP